MLLDELVSGAAGVRSGAEGAPPAGRRALCVVACSDAHVEALPGLGPGDAFVIRVPGAALPSAPAELARLVATAVLVHGCTEVAVIGHLGCRLASLESSELESRAAARGISRGLFGLDARAFFGAISDPAEAARATAAALRRSPLLPRDVPVHALLADEASARLEVLERGYDRKVAADSRGFGGGGAVLGLSPGPVRFGEEGLPPLETFAPLPTLEGFAVRMELPTVSALPAATPLVLSRTELPTPSIELRPTVDLSATVQLGSPIELGAPSIALSVPGPLPGSDGPSMPSAPFDWEQPALVATEVLRPPPGPETSASPAPAARKAPVGHADLEKGLIRGPRSVRLSPPLVKALARVRTFYRAEFGGGTRREVLVALDEAAANGAGAAELAKVAIKPILDAGSKRYTVINDLVALKEGVERLDGSSAHAALRALVE